MTIKRINLSTVLQTNMYFERGKLFSLSHNIIVHEQHLTELYDPQGSNSTFNTAVLPEPYIFF